MNVFEKLSGTPKLRHDGRSGKWCFHALVVTLHAAITIAYVCEQSLTLRG